MLRLPRLVRMIVCLTVCVFIGRSSQADIVYVDIPDQVVYGGGSGNLDFTGDGTVDVGWFLTIHDDFKCFCAGHGVGASGQGGARVAASGFVVTAFDSGQLIGPAETYSFFGDLCLNWESCCGAPPYCEGNWCQEQARFVGVRFSINGALHFAWVRALRVGTSPSSSYIELLDYAFESQPQTVIVAGQMCKADINLDGQVAVDDLLAVLNAWGECPVAPGCLSDINSSGNVDVDDLLGIIGAWGPCG